MLDVYNLKSCFLYLDFLRIKILYTMDNNLNIMYVCRTCMEKIINTSFFYLDFTQVDSEPTIGQKLSYCIPELDLSILPNTVICGKCADTINSLYIFKEECLRLEMQIREYVQQVQHTGNAIDLAALMQFHQLHSKSLTAELVTEAFQKTENCKKEKPTTSFCGNYVFNDTEITNKEYLTSLQMVDRECVVFNTFENFAHSDESEAEENSDTHNDSNIAEGCLLQVVENPDSCIQNFSSPMLVKPSTSTIIVGKKNKDSKIKCGSCSSNNFKYCSKCSTESKQHSNQCNISTLRKDTNIIVKPFKCCLSDICDFSTNYEYNLKTHMLTHSGEKPFKCSICERSFNQKSNLKTYLLTHSGEKPFKCSVCEYSYKHKHHLKSHMLNHIGEKPFKCSICEFSCNYKSNLKKHFLTHTGEKPYKCSVCEYSCHQKQNLKSHMLTHSGEKLFKCSICEYSCHQKQNFKSHMLTHTGEKPFKCSVCEYSCNRRQSLKSHMLIHTGEKPLMSSVFEYSCNGKDSLRDHMLTHTGKEPFKCIVCEYCCNDKNSLKIHMLAHSVRTDILCR